MSEITNSTFGTGSETNTFKGILIGTDNTYDVQINNLGSKAQTEICYYGLIPIVEKHSAVSNIHVNLSGIYNFAKF